MRHLYFHCVYHFKMITLSNWRNKTWIALVIWAFFLPDRTFGQAGKITFTASASKKEVVEGAQVEITWQLSGTTEGKLQLPDLTPFRKAGGLREMSGMQFSNGNVQAHHTWVISLVAPAPGEYTLPEAGITVKGNTYRSNPVSIKVVATGQAARISSISGVPKWADDPNIFIATETNTPRPLVGQQVVCVVNIYTRYGVSGLDLVELPQINKIGLRELERYDNPVEQVTIAGKPYNKQTIYAGAFFPETTGKLTINAAQANVAIVSNNPLQGISTLRLQTAPVVLDVQALPAPAPAGFTGLVGHYTAELKSDRQQIAAGEAVICTVSLRGNGNSRLSAPPAFQMPDGLTTYDPVEKEAETFENGRELVHAQVLEYTISAQKEGNGSCVPQLVWYDPDSSKYITWAPRLEIQVSGQAPLADNGAVDSGFSLHLSSNQKTALGAFGIAALLALLYHWLYHRKKNTADTPLPAVVKETSSPARPAVLPPIPVAEPPAIASPSPPTRHLEQLNQHDFYETLYNQLRQHIAKHLHLSPEKVTLSRATQWAADRGLPIDDLKRFWSTAEMVLYAAQDHSPEREEMYEMVERLTG